MSLLQAAITRLMTPIARVLIARGVRFPEFSDWMKTHYLQSAERFFALDGKRLTDSRLHLLTGLQRKDIAKIRAQTDLPPRAASAGPLPRAVALWLAQHTDADARPMPLPRQGPAPSFEALVSEVSRDVHHRTVQDELLRLGLAEVDGDTIVLTETAFLPARDDEALLGYFGANLGDHAGAAAENLLAAPKPGPHFERAVHYNGLTPEAITELEDLSRALLSESLSQLNARAAVLQKRDRTKPDANGRFRAGAYVYTQQTENAP